MEMFDLNLSMQQLLICKMGIPSSLILKRLYEDKLIVAEHSDVSDEHHSKAWREINSSVCRAGF